MKLFDNWCTANPRVWEPARRCEITEPERISFWCKIRGNWLDVLIEQNRLVLIHLIKLSTNLLQWEKSVSGLCKLCLQAGAELQGRRQETTNHILNGCKVALKMICLKTQQSY